MKTKERMLAQFIEDFSLEKITENTICFDAVVQYQSSSQFKQVPSEVHIITLLQTGLSIIYLLDLSIMQHYIPDTLPFNEQDFNYEKDQALVFTGNDPHAGDYSIRITPNGEDCTDRTNAELRAKKHN